MRPIISIIKGDDHIDLFNHKKMPDKDKHTYLLLRRLIKKARRNEEVVEFLGIKEEDIMRLAEELPAKRTKQKRLSRNGIRKKRNRSNNRSKIESKGKSKIRF